MWPLFWTKFYNAVNSYAWFMHDFIFHSPHWSNRGTKNLVFKAILWVIDLKSLGNSTDCQKQICSGLADTVGVSCGNPGVLRQANLGGQLERMSSTCVHEWDRSLRTLQMTFPARALKITRCLYLMHPVWGRRTSKVIFPFSSLLFTFKLAKKHWELSFNWEIACTLPKKDEALEMQRQSIYSMNKM